MKNIAIITYLPSPYQVEFFDAIAAAKKMDLRVFYLKDLYHDPQSNGEVFQFWQTKAIAHQAVFIEMKTPLEKSETLRRILESDLTIMNYYRHSFCQKAMLELSVQNRPWCFWGERLGVRLPGPVGKLLRHWSLRYLHTSKAPVWGIGKGAVESYQKEFGKCRLYCNVPYFSDLQRFAFSDSKEKRNGQRTVLFSGSLISRKGIDLLLPVFERLLLEFPKAQLNIVGEGRLRAMVSSYTAKSRGRIIFYGFQEWDNLPAFYRQAGVLCAPSRYDGWAMVIPEALASGLPVIATNAMGAAREFIRNDENGYIVKAGDQEQVYQKLKKMLSLPEAEWQQMSQAALNSVSQHQLKDGVHIFHQAIEQTLKVWE